MAKLETLFSKEETQLILSLPLSVATKGISKYGGVLKIGYFLLKAPTSSKRKWSKGEGQEPLQGLVIARYGRKCGSYDS